MNASDIREKFLQFFENAGHTRVSSSSLIPEADPTLLFTNAGMVQFKDVFIGEEKRDYTRAASSQKCVRAGGKHNDLENVGFTARHHTFFEMLGNFSFGDYFKSEAIDYAWTLLTKDFGLDKKHLWVTIHHSDDEAEKLWRKVAGVKADRIKRFGDKDNFWQMGDTGPCGPCSEIHYDQGPSIEGTLNGEGDRYLEIWNLVFMQFEQSADGKRTPLPKPSIDTGMGLERIAAIMQGKTSNYDSDLFTPIIAHAADLAGVKYGPNEEVNTSLRVIADHARATAFLITDGVLPSNEGRGYVLRRIMRRAIRHGVKLELGESFLWNVAGKVVDVMKEAYPELEARRDTMEKIARIEEDRFRETLDAGLKLLQDTIGKLEKKGQTVIPGATAFQLYDTFGFPVDLTRVIAAEKNLDVDLEGYEEEMEKQRARGRASWQGAAENALDVINVAADDSRVSTELMSADACGERNVNEEKVRAELSETLEKAGLSELEADYFAWASTLPFPSYQLHARSQVMMLATLGKDGGPAEELREGATGGLVSWWTPFYAESGGQIGDRGWITNDRGGVFEVQDTQYLEGRLPIHLGRVVSGSFGAGDVIELKVDADFRRPTRLHHTSTHLVHAALRNHLGDHVKQAGSMVAPDRLRFDFSHYEQVTRKQLRAIEDEVNEHIWKAHRAEHQEMSYDDAMKAGALAFFGEKYGSRVRVLSLGDYSIELCGGTHVGNTSEIGVFRLVSEEGIAAGTRRIEALAGPTALAWDQKQEDALSHASALLNVKTEAVPERIGKLLEENKKLVKQIEKLQTQLAEAGASGLVDQAREVGDVRVLATEVDGDPKGLRELASNLRTKLGRGVVVLGVRSGGKVSLVAAVTKDLLETLDANQLIKEIAPLVGGRGGGKPDLAQAGGGDQPEKLPQALERVYDLVQKAAS